MHASCAARAWQVVDEEQRFGVKQKDKIKGVATNVDVLSLTATPIPCASAAAPRLHRTTPRPTPHPSPNRPPLATASPASLAAALPAPHPGVLAAPVEARGRPALIRARPGRRTFYMCATGIRDMSLLRTPPSGRLKVLTSVVERNDEQMLAAVRKELARGGQVFYVVPRIEQVEAEVALLASQLPEATVSYAYSGLRDLEARIVDFTMGDVDVMVATTIMENGIDIPNVNTLVVQNAHLFGLAQMHQLRGRVGRSNLQAYAVLMHPPAHTLSEVAVKRMRALEKSEGLGGGYQIAQSDLQLRGAPPHPPPPPLPLLPPSPPPSSHLPPPSLPHPSPHPPPSARLPRPAVSLSATRRAPRRGQHLRHRAKGRLRHGHHRARPLPRDPPKGDEVPAGARGSAGRGQGNVERGARGATALDGA